MPLPIQASAPGKLFLVGEYAVLEGAPALLTAVDRRARVRLDRSPDNYWHITAPSLGIDDAGLGANGEIPDTLAPRTAEKLSVFDAARRKVLRDPAVTLPALSIHIDTDEFVENGYKLGLGSSAAVTAALMHALFAAAGAECPLPDLAHRAIDAHRAAQRGTGSGGDVATAVYGGLISYRSNERIIPLTWPETLAGMVVATGEGARTTDLVGRVRQYAARSPEPYRADIVPLCDLATKAQHALDDNARFLELAEAYFQALARLDTHARAGIVNHRHHELHALACAHQAVFKTSGAGGGDVGLLFAPQGTVETTLAAAFAKAGAHVLPVTFGAPGVRIDGAEVSHTDRNMR